MLNKIKLIHNISEETIRFEQERKFESMDRNSLFRCLEANIFIKDGKDNSILFEMKGIALLDITIGFCEAYEELRRGKESAEVIDFYGSYRLIIETEHEKQLLKIKEIELEKDIEVEISVFECALRELVQNVDRDITKRFPAICNNPGYREIQKMMKI